MIRGLVWRPDWGLLCAGRLRRAAAGMCLDWACAAREAIFSLAGNIAEGVRFMILLLGKHGFQAELGRFRRAAGIELCLLCLILHMQGWVMLLRAALATAAAASTGSCYLWR